MIVPKFAAPSLRGRRPEIHGVQQVEHLRAQFDRPTAAGRTSRISARSTSRYVGPRTGFRDAVPSENWLAVANAAVLNQRAGVRSSEGSFGSPTRFGRCVVKPA